MLQFPITGNGYYWTVAKNAKLQSINGLYHKSLFKVSWSLVTTNIGAKHDDYIIFDHWTASYRIPSKYVFATARILSQCSLKQYAISFVIQLPATTVHPAKANSKTSRLKKQKCTLIDFSYTFQPNLDAPAPNCNDAWCLFCCLNRSLCETNSSSITKPPPVLNRTYDLTYPKSLENSTKAIQNWLQ